MDCMEDGMGKKDVSIDMTVNRGEFKKNTWCADPLAWDKDRTKTKKSICLNKQIYVI